MQEAEDAAVVHVHECYGDCGGYDDGLAQGAVVDATVSTTQMKILIPIHDHALFQNILLHQDHGHGRNHGSRFHFLDTTLKA